MKKIYSVIQFIVLLLIAPLLWNSNLILAWPIIFIAIIMIFLLISQPNMEIKESQENIKTDQGTMWLITGISSLGQLIGVIDWAYFQNAPIAVDWVAIVGCGMMLFGISFRIWSIRTLDNAFSATVQIKEGQELITSGPYRWFRHPSYTGAWILMIGDAILLHSIPSIVIMSIVMLWVYSKRIKTEEKTLAAAFGEAYIEHEKRTWKMFPGW